MEGEAEEWRLPGRAARSGVIPPWLWLYGPSGVGKSSTGFELYRQLNATGRRVGFLELDQVAMCMPAPVALRSAAKASNLVAILANMGRLGAEAVVVAGDIVGPAMDQVLAEVTTKPVLCRLRASPEVIVERLTIRRSQQRGVLPHLRRGPCGAGG